MTKDRGFIKEVRKKPYSVILFDEIEKAHPDILNILLQILEDGRLTDNFGKVTNFKNTIIIMTSNIGSKLITNKNKLGFGSESETVDYKSLSKNVLKEAKENFREEFLNRIDEIIVFQKLSKTELKEIANIMLNNLEKIMQNKNIKVKFSKNISDFIIGKIEDDTQGARPIRKIIQDFIQDKIVDEYLKGSFKENDEIEVTEINGKICIFKNKTYKLISDVYELQAN